MGAIEFNYWSIVVSLTKGASWIGWTYTPCLDVHGSADLMCIISSPGSFNRFKTTDTDNEANPLPLQGRIVLGYFKSIHFLLHYWLQIRLSLYSHFLVSEGVDDCLLHIDPLLLKLQHLIGTRKLNSFNWLSLPALVSLLYHIQISNNRV